MERAVFIYTYAQSAESNEWTLIDELSNGGCDAGFGISVAFEQGRLLAGCDAENLNTGAIYYFESSMSNQYSVVQKIISLDGRSRDNLGGSDQIATVTTASGSFMAAGTYRNKNGGVYIFKLDEQNNLWKEISKLDPVASSKQFGDRVVMSGDKLIVSSACNVYAYTLEDCFE